jgi:hypothetical protein
MGAKTNPTIYNVVACGLTAAATILTVVMLWGTVFHH